MTVTPLLRRPTLLWYGLALLSAIAVGVGLYCYSLQLARGEVATGLRNPGHGGAAWGFYIVFYVYFVGVSFAGITVASLARVFHIDALKPVTRLAELLTIVSLMVGAMMVIADLGQPLGGLTKLPALARPSSPFFGTFTLVVSGYLFSSLVFFVLSGRHDAAAMARTGPRPLRPLYRVWAAGFRDEDVVHARHWKTSFVLAMTIMPLLVIAHSTLGFIFGIQAGRPGWFSALQAPAFVVLAGVSGTGALIVLAAAVRRVFRLEDRIPTSALRWLGNLLWVLVLVYLYFMIVEELTSTYAAPRADRHIAHEVVGGTFSRSFWITVACLGVAFIIPFASYLRDRITIAGLVVAGILANFAAVLKRLLIVVPSQTHGGLLKLREGEYVPTWIELGVVLGAIGLLLFAILIFGRVFPLVPTPVDPARRAAPVVREPLRTIATTACALVAAALIALGLSDSFRLWSRGELDPVIPYSPALFATGVILLFASAIVYEAFPARRRTLPPRATWRRSAGTRRIGVPTPLRVRDLRARRQS